MTRFHHRPVALGALRLAALLWIALAFFWSPLARGESHAWPRFLGPELKGRSAETGIRKDWSGDKLPIVWERSVGEGYSRPSVADGRLYLFDRLGDRARLTCLDAATGDKIWRREYTTKYEDRFGFSNGPRSSPVVDGDRVYTFGVEGRLRAHRTSDGELLWEVDTAHDFAVVENFFGVGSTPVIEGDLLIAMIGGSPTDEAGAGSGIVAFDKMTGAVRYRVSDELASYSSPITHRHDDRPWAFAFARGGLIGFDPTSGEIDFHFPWRSKKVYSVNAASPVVVDDTVLITEAYGPGSALLRFRPGGYDLIRSDDPKSRERSIASHWATPIYDRGSLFGSSGEKTGTADLRCVDHATGKVRWSRKGLGRTTLLFVDGHLLALNEWGNLMLIEASCEEFRLVTEIAFERLGNPTWNAPILADGILYLRGSERLLALELIPGPVSDAP